MASTYQCQCGEPPIFQLLHLLPLFSRLCSCLSLIVDSVDLLQGIRRLVGASPSPPEQKDKSPKQPLELGYHTVQLNTLSTQISGPLEQVPSVYNKKGWTRCVVGGRHAVAPPLQEKASERKAEKEEAEAEEKWEEVNVQSPRPSRR